MHSNTHLLTPHSSIIFLTQKIQTKVFKNNTKAMVNYSLICSIKAKEHISKMKKMNKSELEEYGRTICKIYDALKQHNYEVHHINCLRSSEDFCNALDRDTIITSVLSDMEYDLSMMPKNIVVASMNDHNPQGDMYHALRNFCLEDRFIIGGAEWSGSFNDAEKVEDGFAFYSKYNKCLYMFRIDSIENRAPTKKCDNGYFDAPGLYLGNSGGFYRRTLILSKYLGCVKINMDLCIRRTMRMQTS